MSKLKKLKTFVRLLLEKPSLINIILNSEYYWHQRLKRSYSNINQLRTTSILNFLENKEDSLNTFSFLGGGSLPTDILLLKAICSRLKSCSYFEIGTWRGESVINVASVADECYTLNLSKKEIIAMDLPKQYANLHGFYSKGIPNINHLYGNSLNYDFSGLKKKFDVIFIDGDHTYEFVKNDTKKVYKNLIKENSIIVWHDYARTPENPRPEVLLGILDGLPVHEHKYLYHVSNTLCAIYTKEKLEAKLEIFPVEPKHKFTVTLKNSEI